MCFQRCIEQSAAGERERNTVKQQPTTKPLVNVCQKLAQPWLCTIQCWLWAAFFKMRKHCRFTVINWMRSNRLISRALHVPRNVSPLILIQFFVCCHCNGDCRKPSKPIALVACLCIISILCVFYMVFCICLVCAHWMWHDKITKTKTITICHFFSLFVLSFAIN